MGGNSAATRLEFLELNFSLHLPACQAVFGAVNYPEMSNAGHHSAAVRLGGRQKLAGGGSGAWPCWIVQSVHNQNNTDYLAGNSFAE